MHELPITENVLEIVLRNARQTGSGKVKDVYLVIGQLASIVDDSVQFYWDIVAKDSQAEGAQLHFRRIPLEMQCLDCQTSFQPEEYSYECPQCNSNRVQVISGREFFVEAIEVENV